MQVGRLRVNIPELVKAFFSRTLRWSKFVWSSCCGIQTLLKYELKNNVLITSCAQVADVNKEPFQGIPVHCIPLLRLFESINVPSCDHVTNSFQVETFDQSLSCFWNNRRCFTSSLGWNFTKIVQVYDSGLTTNGSPPTIWKPDTQGLNPNGPW